MARTKKVNSDTSKNTPSIAEMREFYEKNKTKWDNFERFKEAIINLREVNKTTKLSTSIEAIPQEDLKRYLENPTSYEKKLRDISRYLVTRSQVYYRLIKYNANMFDLNARSVIPNYSLTKTNDKNKMKKNYENTLKILDKMGLQFEFLKVFVTCMIEDVFYGVVYFDKSVKTTPAMFILPLPADYCRIQGYWDNGTFAYVLDMSLFNKRPDLLEFWGEPFTTLYKEYQKDKIRWKLMPQEWSVCLKFRSEDPETILPPLLGLFLELLGLIEAVDIEHIASEQDIYKLLVATIPLLSGANSPDEFAVDPKLAVQYFNKMCEALPRFTDAIISPIPVDHISFDSDSVDANTNKVQNAIKTVLNTSGGSQVLYSSDISSSSGYEFAAISDTEFAISSLLPQAEAWVNFFLSQYITNPCKVKFFEISVYTRKQFRKELIENAQNGLPMKLALGTLSGLSEMDILALNFLEEDVLSLSDKLIPLSTSYTKTGDDGKKSGGQEKDIDDLTDEGEKTRDKK